MDPRPTWLLVLESAERLTNDQRTPFRLAELISIIQSKDATRQRESIQPIVQGMTANAGKGPPAPCGKPLWRVSHGYYELRTSEIVVRKITGAVRARGRARRSNDDFRHNSPEVETRVSGLVADFDFCVDAYDADVPFKRNGQFQLHQQTIARRRSVGSVAAAIEDGQFTDLLYRTLQKWGIGRRGSRLVALGDFRATISAKANELIALDGTRIEDPAIDLGEVIAQIDELVSDLNVVENKARIVAGTKTLHHLLPDLVPPMDRAWTGAFFGWSPIDPQNNQLVLLQQSMTAFAMVAQTAKPERLVGPGWRTSSTKILDNALIGYCKSRGIGG